MHNTSKELIAVEGLIIPASEAFVNRLREGTNNFADSTLATWITKAVGPAELLPFCLALGHCPAFLDGKCASVKGREGPMPGLAELRCLSAIALKLLDRDQIRGHVGVSQKELWSDLREEVVGGGPEHKVRAVARTKSFCLNTKDETDVFATCLCRK